jgi:hypothetical protein
MPGELPQRVILVGDVADPAKQVEHVQGVEGCFGISDYEYCLMPTAGGRLRGTGIGKGVGVEVEVGASREGRTYPLQTAVPRFGTRDAARTGNSKSGCACP